MKRSNELEREAIIRCAEFMAAAARTSPKTRGIDNIVSCLIDDKADIKELAMTMREIGKRESRPSMERDAGSVESLEAVFILGVKDNPAGLNCGFCGYKNCEALAAAGAMCAFNSIDLGIAMGSAVAAANALHADNRIMYSIGRAVLAKGIFDKGTRQVLGVPLSISGKNPFFDRK